jgi:hypothetical protein
LARLGGGILAAWARLACAKGEQRVQGQVFALVQEDGEHHLLRHEIGRECPAALRDVVGELLAHVGWTVDEVQRGVQPLEEEAAERRGTRGEFDVNQLVAGSEQVADLQGATPSQRVSHLLARVEAQVDAGVAVRDTKVVVAFGLAEVPLGKVQAGSGREERGDLVP